MKPFWTRSWLRVELVLGIVLMALAMMQTGQMAGAMASNSLSTDEFGTIGTFSSKGPGRVITDYRAPKNHVFFNLLNSILPGRESLHSARVRLFSILATAAIPVLLVLFAMALGRFLEAGVFLALWSLAPQMLELSMEARGYGFLALFALVASIATLGYLRTSHRFFLALIALSVVLGTYTIPSFLFFGAPLLLLLFLATRRRETFVAGAIAGGTILLLYSPLLTQLYAAITEFSDDPDRDFASWHGLVRAVNLYLFSATFPATLAFIAALTVTPFALFAIDRRSPDSLAFLLITAASLATGAILLLLETPPVRVAAFVTVPFTFAGVFAAGHLIRNFAPLPLRILIVAPLGYVLVTNAGPALRAMNFVPAEDWSRAANWIDAAFPPNHPVDFKTRAKYLKQTLADSKARSAEFDESAFTAGQLVVADARNKWADETHFSRPADEPRVATVSVPGDIRDVNLTFRLPTDRTISDVPPELTDGRMDVGVLPADLTFRASNGHALVILFDRPVRQRFAVAHVRDAKTGEKLTEDPGVVHAGNSVAIPIPPRTIIEAEFELYDPEARIVEAWISPAE
ncbi:MAG: hypothetical protein WA771_08865 [Chthoniobacterales bacterium]